MPVLVSWLKPLIIPILRPAVRILVGMLAIPVLRALRKRIAPESEWDEELSKDLEQWCRASLVLWLATKNMEEAVATWLTANQDIEIDFDRWYLVAGRLLLAVGVVETMPDQQLFSIIHPGPSRLRWNKACSIRENCRTQVGPFIQSVACLYLSRSSPVYAILSVFFSGPEGWVFFLLAISQYLVIGLVTSRDKALDVLSQFDAQVARKRQEIVEEFEIGKQRQPPAP